MEDDFMNQEKLNIVKNNKGFIAALDQSGGSSAKTLKTYGIPEDRYSSRSRHLWSGVERAPAGSYGSCPAEKQQPGAAFSGRSFPDGL